MRRVRLVREIKTSDGRGPGNGMCALQKALRARCPDWLTIGGVPQPGELLWAWHWEDKGLAVLWGAQGDPFVIGPNVLFENSRTPRKAPGERELCGARNCVLQFTESQWYRELISRNCHPPNFAPVVMWPYPIDPQPGPPLAVNYDLLIYEKSGVHPDTVTLLQNQYPRNRRIRYGKYKRQRLFDLARKSRCCAYLSDDDRGPLALAEIMLAGCPAVGVEGGAPWVVDGMTGYEAEDLTYTPLAAAIEKARLLDRDSVRAEALEKFDTDRTVTTILAALDNARDL